MDLQELKEERTAVHYSALAERAKTDKEAFAELYDYYFPRIYNYIFARLKNPDQADDIVSATFEKVLLKLSSYEQSRGSFSGWIFRIAGNEINNYFRQGRWQHEAGWDEFFDPADERATPEQELLTREGNSELLLALDSLKDTERQIVELKYFADLGNKDIAARLQLTPDNVGVILHRALQKLKKFLEKNL